MESTSQQKRQGLPRKLRILDPKTLNTVDDINPASLNNKEYTHNSHSLGSLSSCRIYNINSSRPCSLIVPLKPETLTLTVVVPKVFLICTTRASGCVVVPRLKGEGVPSMFSAWGSLWEGSFKCSL